MTLESASVNRTQPKPAAFSWRAIIADNNPTDTDWQSEIRCNNGRGELPCFNLCWTEEIPF